MNWIPVGESSPEPLQKVLIAHKVGEDVLTVSGYFELGRVKYPNGFVPDDRDWAVDAIAWMPSPQYTGESCLSYEQLKAIATGVSLSSVYLIERRDREGNTLDNVAIVSRLDLVEEAIAIYLKDGLDPADDVGDWHFQTLMVEVDSLDSTNMFAREMPRHDRYGNVIIQLEE